METIHRVLAVAACVAAAAAAAAGFDDDFTGATLRVDYTHTGTAQEEHFALELARVEGPWPGSRTQTLDPTNLGKYLVEVADLKTNRLLYSRGFASIYGEWETTGEAARGFWRAFREAVRVPEPRAPFQLRIRKRQPDQTFREVWSLPIDPSSRFVDRPPATGLRVRGIVESGDPAVKVDLVVLGDGYSVAKSDKFLTDAQRLADALFAAEPFRSRKSDFNVWAVETPARQEGVTRPRIGAFRDTPLRTRYNVFDTERYVLTLDDAAWRDAAAAAPYDFVLILVNEQQYGGGGIFGLYSTAAVDSAYAPYLVVHEFGHHFAGLADEYYTSPTSYESLPGPQVEPWEPNVTALAEAQRLKWGDLVVAGTPVPTPWTKEEFETHSREFQAKRAELRAAQAEECQLEALFDTEKALFTKMLGEQEHSGKVGAFEGAAYEAKGLFRPTIDCIMFTRDEVGFCPVCRRAIERIIDLYAR